MGVGEIVITDIDAERLQVIHSWIFLDDKTMIQILVKRNTYQMNVAYILPKRLLRIWVQLEHILLNHPE